MKRGGYGWLCEKPTAALDESWANDAYWAEANDRFAHEVPVCYGNGCTRHRYGLSSPVKFNELTRQLFYGDNSHPGVPQMMGLGRLFSTLKLGEAQCAANVINAGAALNAGAAPDAAFLSAYAVVWGPRTVYMVTPDGWPPGYLTEAAIVVADWRYVARLANIAITIERDELIRRLAVMIRRFTELNFDRHRPAIYMNTELRNRLQMRVFEQFPIKAIDELHHKENRVD